MHNPFLGGGALPGPRHLLANNRDAGPQPDPWQPVASLMMMAAGLRDLAAHLPDGQKALGAAIGQTVADWDDWFCGTPPHPRPWTIAAAVQLLAIAATMEAGSLRTAVASQATRVLEKSFAGQAEQAGQVTSIAG
jgi:hypothetical protein